MKLASALAALTLLAACSSPPEPDRPGHATGPGIDDVSGFLADATARLQPLRTAAARTWYEASIAGSDDAFARSKDAELALNRFYADPERFARVRALRDDARVTDPLERRQIELLYLGMLGKQIAPELLEQLTSLEKEVEQIFNTHRGQVAGEAKSSNDIDAILNDSTDSALLRQAWEAQKSVGAAVAPKLATLAGLRNQAAQKLGFRDFYAMRLAESELDEAELLALFDELDRLTRAPFLAAKAEVDRRLARRLGVAVDQLMPWHYQNPFFQSPPQVFDTGLDALYREQDTVALGVRFFEDIGLPAADIVARSDLHEKPGKTPHAFATDIDRAGDVRILLNVAPGLRWQTTTVHELGHAVYSKYIARDLPWLLRAPSHALTTEGLAMMLDAVVADPRWAHAMGIMDEASSRAAAAEAHAYQAFAALQFSRWTQVMLHFERAMYGDPTQDLNKLWWDLVEEYQALRRPEGRDAPDYASKIHLVVAPVYYQNYMLGRLFAAQVHEAIAASLGQEPAAAVYVGDARVGQFLKDRVFGPGARYRWDELTERATGGKLSAAAFARRFQTP